ncbi:hypothetical protein RB195_023411 [Necator americanus]|uniref:Myotubularin phosphatase domain-containing protein n=2 Tax=Necator americanus TaxID=51031 RepID=A0ABR1ELK0_NECAM
MVLLQFLCVWSSSNERIGFVPDYSVVVRDECTFLEVTAQNWLLAYRSTLMSRTGARPSVVEASGVNTKTAKDDSSWTAVQDKPREDVLSPQKWDMFVNATISTDESLLLWICSLSLINVVIQSE